MSCWLRGITSYVPTVELAARQQTVAYLGPNPMKALTTGSACHWLNSGSLIGLPPDHHFLYGWV